MKKIPGGYYIKARKIQESNIARQPPSVREIWDWLLMNANHKDVKYAGFTVKRGQLFRTYNDIREGLHWMVGRRKMMYSENHTKKAMKFLRRAGMITTKKEPGGVLITICNYDIYQNPKNYEGTNEGTNEGTIEEPLKNQTLPYNNKNVKNEKNENNNRVVVDDLETYAKNIGWESFDLDAFLDEYMIGGYLMVGDEPMKNPKAFIKYLFNHHREQVKLEEYGREDKKMKKLYAAANEFENRRKNGMDDATVLKIMMDKGWDKDILYRLINEYGFERLSGKFSDTTKEAVKALS